MNTTPQNTTPDVRPLDVPSVPHHAFFLVAVAAAVFGAVIPANLTPRPAMAALGMLFAYIGVGIAALVTHMDWRKGTRDWDSVGLTILLSAIGFLVIFITTAGMPVTFGENGHAKLDMYRMAVMGLGFYAGLAVEIRYAMRRYLVIDERPTEPTPVV